jgi:hypothetical protein
VKAVLVALALMLAPPPAATTVPAKPKPAAQTPDATAPAAAPAAKPVAPIAVTDPVAECRATCAKSHFFCLQDQDEDTCSPTWTQCRAACERANR